MSHGRAQRAVTGNTVKSCYKYNRAPSWSRAVERDRSKTAAVMRRSGKDAPEAYICRHVSALTPFFEWQA